MALSSYEINNNLIGKNNNMDLYNNNIYNDLENQNQINIYETQKDNNLFSFSNNYFYNTSNYDYDYHPKEFIEPGNLLLEKYNDNYRNEYNIINDYKNNYDDTSKTFITKNYLPYNKYANYSPIPIYQKIDLNYNDKYFNYKKAYLVNKYINNNDNYTKDYNKYIIKDSPKIINFNKDYNYNIN